MDCNLNFVDSQGMKRIPAVFGGQSHAVKHHAVQQLCVGGGRLELLAAHQQSGNPEVAELFGFFTIKVGEIDLRLHENHLDMRNFGNKKMDIHVFA